MRYKGQVNWNVSKYKIELKSVYLTIVTWDLTERWTENVSKYKIELKSVYVHGNFKCNIRFIGISYNYIVNKYGIYMKFVYLTW